MANSTSNLQVDAAASEWFLELDTSDEDIGTPLSEPQPQYNNWDTDSGYEPSPAYFANERRFEYPPIEDVDEGDDEEDEDLLDDVFVDSATSFPDTPSTPRSYAIPIPARKPSTPTSEDVHETQDYLPSRPHSCPLRDPEFELDYDDFLDSGEELDSVVENLKSHLSVSTQTDWMFDEELVHLNHASNQPSGSNVPDVVPRRLPRMQPRNLPRRAVSFNEVDFITIGYELRRLSDRWEDARRQKKALENPNTFIDFVYNAISSSRERRRPRVPPTFLR